MKIEYAIRYLDDLKRCGKEEFGIAWDMLAAVEMGAAALREKAERDKGCEYCNDQEVIAWDMCNDGIVVESNGKMHMLSGGDWEAEIDFCPMCGRKLKGENQ